MSRDKIPACRKYWWRLAQHHQECCGHQKAFGVPATLSKRYCWASTAWPTAPQEGSDGARTCLSKLSDNTSLTRCGDVRKWPLTIQLPKAKNDISRPRCQRGPHHMWRGSLARGEAQQSCQLRIQQQICGNLELICGYLQPQAQFTAVDVRQSTCPRLRIR